MTDPHIDFTEIDHTTDHWELFARDYLQRMGLHVESGPDRGADGGKDLLVTENLTGALYSGRFRWLVSCKHFATSSKSVNENDHETNILERVSGFAAQGFLGFYSTLPSSGLNSRLAQLLRENKLQAFRILDGKLIENQLVTAGYSDLAMRYFPTSYRRCKPLHLVLGEYLPLKCEHCGIDLLQSMYQADYTGIYVAAYRRTDHGPRMIEDVYAACKGACDKTMQERSRARGLTTGWEDLSDLVIPVQFLQRLFAIMNCIRSGTDVYSDAAYQKEKALHIALSQRVLRYVTAEDKERFLDNLHLGSLGL